jgi:hypothetical protein
MNHKKINPCQTYTDSQLITTLKQVESAISQAAITPIREKDLANLKEQSKNLNAEIDFRIAKAEKAGR